MIAPRENINEKVDKDGHPSRLMEEFKSIEDYPIIEVMEFSKEQLKDAMLSPSKLESL